MREKKEKQQLPQLLPSLFSGNARIRRNVIPREVITLHDFQLRPGQKGLAGEHAPRDANAAANSETLRILVSDLMRVQIADWIAAVVLNPVVAGL